MSNDRLLNLIDEGHEAGRRMILTDLRTIFELVQGDDPDHALNHIVESYDDEERHLLIKIFKLEDKWKEWGEE